MALVLCPHCGKSISDSAKACVHCGESIVKTVNATTPDMSRAVPPAKEQVTATQKYMYLPMSKQKSLYREFEVLFPDYGKKRKTRRAIGIITFTSLGIVVVWLCAVLVMCYTNSLSDSFVKTSLIIAGVVCVLSVVGGIYFRVTIYDALPYSKLYIYWLKECKNIEYNATFDAKTAKKYNELTISNEDKRKIEQCKR